MSDVSVPRERKEDDKEETRAKLGEIWGSFAPKKTLELVLMAAEGDKVCRFGKSKSLGSLHTDDNREDQKGDDTSSAIRSTIPETFLRDVVELPKDPVRVFCTESDPKHNSGGLHPCPSHRFLLDMDSDTESTMDNDEWMSISGTISEEDDEEFIFEGFLI